MRSRDRPSCSRYAVCNRPPTSAVEKSRTTRRFTKSFQATRGSSCAVLSDIRMAGTPCSAHQASATKAARSDQPGIATASGRALSNAFRTRRRTSSAAASRLSPRGKSVTRSKPCAPWIFSQPYSAVSAESSIAVSSQTRAAASSRARWYGPKRWKMIARRMAQKTEKLKS